MPFCGASSMRGKFCSASCRTRLSLIHYRSCRDLRQPTREEGSVYDAIRQGKAKTGMAEELTRRVKEGAIPILSE